MWKLDYERAGMEAERDGDQMGGEGSRKESWWKWLFVSTTVRAFKCQVGSRTGAPLRRPSEACFIQCGSWERTENLLCECLCVK